MAGVPCHSAIWWDLQFDVCGSTASLGYLLDHAPESSQRHVPSSCQQRTLNAFGVAKYPNFMVYGRAAAWPQPRLRADRHLVHRRPDLAIGGALLVAPALAVTSTSPPASGHGRRERAS